VVAHGSGRLYADLVMSSYPSGMAQPKGTGFTIERKIYLKGDTIPVDPSQLIAGKMYRVELVVTNGQNLSFVAINDPIPAGCESINPDFRSADQREAVKNTRWESRSVLSHSEFRDERILLFADQLYAGTTSYSYLFKAVTPGNYFWPAVSVEAMYFPEMYGHGEERRVVIQSSGK